MKCFDEKIYAAYLDNDLIQKKREKISAHLESCQKCRTLVEDLKKENLMIKAAFHINLPSLDLTSDIKQRLKFVEMQTSSNGKKFSYSLYFALILSGLIFPLLIYHLFVNLIDKFRETLSFFFSPISILFDTFIFLKNIILNTSMIDLSKVLIFLFVPIIMILFAISLLFKKGYEPSP